MPYFVYILQSEVKDTYYIGCSEKPETRLHFHNNQSRKAYTKRYRPWQLVFKRECDSKETALNLERRIKGWKSTRMIRLLIENQIQL